MSSADPLPATSRGGTSVQQIESLIDTLSDKDFRALVARKLSQSLSEGSSQPSTKTSQAKKRGSDNAAEDSETEESSEEEPESDEQEDQEERQQDQTGKETELKIKETQTVLRAAGRYAEKNSALSKKFDNLVLPGSSSAQQPLAKEVPELVSLFDSTGETPQVTQRWFRPSFASPLDRPYQRKDRLFCLCQL